MKHWHLSLLPLVLVACTSGRDDATAADEVNSARSKVSGYDFSGPTALPNDRVPAEFCAAVVSDEQSACEASNGSVLRANGCKVLCSEPIARAGKAAGFDFAGFKQVGTDQLAEIACPAVLSEEAAACDRAEGKSSPVNDCGVLCSKPIAASGKVAGFGLRGFEILEASDSPPICPAVVSEVRTRCEAIGGSVAQAGCADLCSLPL